MGSYVARRLGGVLVTLVTVSMTMANARADQQSAGAPPPCTAAPPSVIWAAFILTMLLILLLFLMVAVGLLRSKDWHLGDAVSEEAGNQPSTLPVGTKPVMVASSSRLIALLGLLVILVMFLGFGYYFLYAAFTCNLETGNVKQVV